MQFISNLIVHLLIVLKPTVSHKSGCFIVTSDLDQNQPIILNKHFELFYPDDGVEIHIPKNEEIIVSCIGAKNYKLNTVNSTFLNITCFSGETFILGGKRVKLDDLQCKKIPNYSARFTKKKCAKSFQEIEVGFDLDVRFVRVLDICFDPVLQATFYSHFSLTKWISGAQTTGRVSWINVLYNLNGQNVNILYSKNNQKKQINYLLELPLNSNKIVKDDNSHYLARGHLTAKADVYYVHQQRTTFFSINAAPQWQSFNNGNWKILEIAVRKLATTRNIDLEIYTGTYKILEMTSSKTKSEIKLFLFEEKGKFGLPVPLFFWKIVYNLKTKAGVAFIGVNNPYITRNQLIGLEICHSISEKIKWVQFKENNFDFGYCYACRLREFLRVVKDAPRLQTKALLE